MALVKNPFQSGEASGKVGSLVASRNRSGAIMRQNAKPVQPRTPSQTGQRYAFTQVSNGFLSLSTTNIEDWNNFGNNYTVPNRLGDASNITGRNWFIGLNSRLLRAGLSMHYSPPLNPEPTFLPNVSLAQTAGGGAINVGFNVSIADGNRLWIYGTNNLTKTRRFKAGSMRLLTIFDTGDSATNYSIRGTSDLSFNDSSVQFETVSVDSDGRATAPLRFTIFPAS